MDAQKLGRKIRETCLAKRLTQSEVVGDFTTRSMPSQTENGATTPFIKTLEYLSRVLSVPMSQLVPGDDPIETLTRARTVLAQGQAGRTLSLVGDLIYDLHDKSDTIVARAHLILVRQLAQHHEYVSAATHARLTAGRAQRDIYACADVRVSTLSLSDEVGQS